MTNQEHHNLLFRVHISPCYHARRLFFFQVLSRWTNVPVLLLGTATAALAVQDSSLWMFGSGLGIALVSILKLVFAPEVKVARQAELLRDYTVLVRRLYANSSPTTVKAVAEEHSKLEFLEPAGMPVVWALCHNTLLRTIGFAGKKDPIAVAWWQRLTAHFFNFGIHGLVKRD